MDPELNSNSSEAEEDSFLLNNESDRINSFNSSDDNTEHKDVIEHEDTRSELKFDEGTSFSYFTSCFFYLFSCLFIRI